MKRNFPIFALLLVAVLWFYNCQDEERSQKKSRSQTTVSSRDTKSAARTDEFEIVLDDSEGEISLAANFYIIFDGSGSMGDRPGGACSGDQQFRYKIDGAKWALREFIKNVPRDANLGLYVFDSRARKERVSLGPDNRTTFEDAVDDIEDGGNTPLARAIRFGTDRLVEQYKKQLGYGTYRLIVVTDGQASNIPDAVEYATERGMPIYAIGLCIGNDHPLRELAHSYRAADSAADLQRSLKEAVAESETFDATEFEDL